MRKKFILYFVLTAIIAILSTLTYLFTKVSNSRDSLLNKIPQMDSSFKELTRSNNGMIKRTDSVIALLKIQGTELNTTINQRDGYHASLLIAKEDLRKLRNDTTAKGEKFRVKENELLATIANLEQKIKLTDNALDIPRISEVNSKQIPRKKLIQSEDEIPTSIPREVETMRFSTNLTRSIRVTDTFYFRLLFTNKNLGYENFELPNIIGRVEKYSSDHIDIIFTGLKNKLNAGLYNAVMYFKNDRINIWYRIDSLPDSEINDLTN